MAEREMLQGHPQLNQDPSWRAKVLPVYRFDPNVPEARPFGLGTAFRIDPWGNCATAFHVVEDFLDLKGGELAVRESVRLVALEMEGIIFGSPPVPQDAWRPLSGFYAEAGKTEPALFSEKPQVRNLTELAALNFSRSHDRTPMPYFPVSLTLDPPQVGDVVTGYGFAGLDVAEDGEGDDRPMSQYLYQSSGQVIEVVPADPASTMPWPRFRVSAEWPSGMSGGPVVDAAGNVIGIISRGWTGEADSTATHFAGWEIARRHFATLDPAVPGRFCGYGGIDAADRVRFIGHDLAEANAYAAAHDLTVRPISFRPDTGEWIAL